MILQGFSPGTFFFFNIISKIFLFSMQTIFFSSPYSICYNTASSLSFCFLVMRAMGTQLPEQGLNRHLCIGKRGLNHWTTREVLAVLASRITLPPKSEEVQKKPLFKKVNLYRVIACKILLFQSLNLGVTEAALPASAADPKRGPPLLGSTASLDPGG